MPYGLEPIQTIAAGDIGTNLFVKLTSTGWSDCTVAGELVHGVSSPAALNAPVPSQTTQYAGELNLPMQVTPPGNICEVLVGTGGTTIGVRVMTDADGKAVAATTTKMAAGVALATCAAGELCPIRLENTYFA